MQEDRTLVGLCECGCGQRPNPAPFNDATRGYVKGEPVRFVRGHHRRSTSERYLVDAESGCWIWQGAFNDRGYGISQTTLAHRVVYEQHVGPVPEGLELDHLCRNRGCVNPDHLEPVTGAENRRRAIVAKRREGRAGSVWHTTTATGRLRWKAHIDWDRTRYRLGTFDTEADARAAIAAFTEARLASA